MISESNIATKSRSEECLRSEHIRAGLRRFSTSFLSGWGSLLLIMIIVAEIGLRIPFVSASLPDPTPRLWHALLVQEKLDYLAAVEAEFGVDLLFIGNSTTQAGVNPAVFEQALFTQSLRETQRGHSSPLNDWEEEDGKGGVSFNASIEGLPPFGNEMFLPIFLKRAQPQTIIYGVSAQDLNSNSPWAADVTERVNHSPLALAESERGLRGWFVGMMLDYSRIYRYRPILLQMILNGGKQESHLEEIFFDERGHDAIEHSLADIAPENRGYLYNNAGVLNYGVEGVQQESLLRLIETVKARGIELILVNMPLADDYYGNFDQVEDYTTYLDTITAIAAENNVPFWDMEELGEKNFSDDEFADFNHLNAAGAKRLSRILAERLNE